MFQIAYVIFAFQSLIPNSLRMELLFFEGGTDVGKISKQSDTQMRFGTQAALYVG